MKPYEEFLGKKAIIWKSKSSIFKGDGKFFERAKKLSAKAEYVFCASATPSPNSVEEMGRQAEVLGNQDNL